VSSLRVKLNHAVLDSDFDHLEAVIIVGSEGAHLWIQDKNGEAVLMADLDVHTLRAVATAAEGERRKKR
jgi:hypothetical protein